MIRDALEFYSASALPESKEQSSFSAEAKERIVVCSEFESGE
jgi:hypothetical protein